MDTNNIALLQLLRICSPSLPIGSYAYSQGLESACENNHVNDSDSLHAWISGMLEYSLQYLDIPVFAKLYDAHTSNDSASIHYWNDYALASRETKELLLEDSQMGGALIQLLSKLSLPKLDVDKNHCSLLTSFSFACHHWQIDKRTATFGLIWSWCENQVSIGIKLIPLGQTSGQQTLSKLMQEIPKIIDAGLVIEDETIGASCPGAVLHSMRHEEQYSRLFRS